MATRSKAAGPAKSAQAGSGTTSVSKPAVKATPLSQPAKAPTRAPASAKPTTKAPTKVVSMPATPAKPVGPSRKKVPAMKSPAKSSKPARAAVSDEQRRNYIEVAAYYIAERRGFFGASALEDWTQAEAEVDRMLREGKLNP